MSNLRILCLKSFFQHLCLMIIQIMLVQMDSTKSYRLLKYVARTQILSSIAMEGLVHNDSTRTIHLVPGNHSPYAFSSRLLR